MENFPELLTERLRLRDLRGDDATALFAICSDADAMRWAGTDPLTDPLQASRLIEFYQSWQEGDVSGVRWAIERRDSGLLIGTVGFCKWDHNWHVCTVGYELAVQARGRGYMSEALYAALLWALTGMDVNRVEAQVCAENLPSVKLLGRVGFRKEGVLRSLGYWGGQYHDLEAYGLLRQDLLRRLDPVPPTKK